MMRVQVKEGEMTKTIYTHIMEQKYDKAVKILNQQLQFFPESRCALLLGLSLVCGLVAASRREPMRLAS